MLTETQCESMERIARHCSRTYRGSTPLLTIDDRIEAALDGIVEYVHEHGWPREDKDLFRAGSAAIEHAAGESVKHLTRGNFWVRPRPNEDPLAEMVTDRIGVWQVAWSLTEKEWAALWAVAEAMKWDGSRADAAALLGVPVGRLSENLSRARRKCRAAWLAPGETPRGSYHAQHNGKISKIQKSRYNREYYRRHAA